MPVYRSFADLPVILYALFVNKIEIPFTMGTREDLPAVKLIEKLIKRIGYLPAIRRSDQSLQWNYINQAIVREIIDKYRFLLMFQNDVRIRSGKFNHPTVSDISIQWLLQAYLQAMQSDGKNVYIFPLSINYDRIFEIRNIADMIVSGEPDNMGLRDMKRKIDKVKGHKLGRVYVKFGNVISLKDYFGPTQKGVLKPSNIANESLQLT